jgi:large subunit ribosomal protein L5
MAEKEQSTKTKKTTKASAKPSAVKKTAPKKKATKAQTSAAPKETGKVKATKQAKAKAKAAKATYLPNLRKRYYEHVVPSLMKRFDYRNVHQVPRLRLISLNMGIGDAKTNPKTLESALKELTLIAGQKAIVTASRKDISNFKVRKGFPVGCKVTLRGNRMYEFLERLISIALPRTRDFRGLSFKSFDRKGNYAFGIQEQIVFTEIDYDKIDTIRGLDVNIATTAQSDEEAYWLLKEFGFPLREKPVKAVAELTEAA